MTLTKAETQELQGKYAYLTNYEAEEADAPINPLTYVDSNGDTLLHIAAQRGDIRTLELLLEAGVDANKAGDMGNTALHYAQTEYVARILLSHGASADACNEFGKTPSLSAGR
ncbi:ankyrin repeat domain-containing protein [Pleomorphomonas sp. PLEO]|uniref:ankyrin repeat domain-containing protein n=1 Tax=Pleomorphomonas sp. PLEO TaxID=3239306 RepID=UPI00351F47ED